MKPHFIFLCLLFLSAISCSKLDSPPIDAKVIGCGYLQQTNDSLYLEVGQDKYHAVIVYTEDRHCHKNSHTKIKPIKDLPVTCFTAKTFKSYQFVIGHKDVQQIEEIFKENYFIEVIFFCFLVIWVLIYLGDVLFKPKSKTKYFLD